MNWPLKPHQPWSSLKRRRLAWVGMAVVGLIIIISWVILLPYTLAEPRPISFFASFKQKFAALRQTLAPPSSPLAKNLKTQTAAELIKASLTNEQQLVAEPGGLFIITPPKNWTIMLVTSTRAELLASSTSLSIAYPTLASETLLNATTTTITVYNRPAILAVTTGQAQIVSQRPPGYLVIRARGASAEALIKQLLNDVKFIQE